MAIKDLRIVAGNETLLRPVSFDIRPGEILAIIGPAGSGKTTFLRALNRLIDLDRGLGVSAGRDPYGAPFRQVVDDRVVHEVRSHLKQERG